MSVKDPTIFVQIASYRDPECQWTVKDLFLKAQKPERVTVGICWQYDKEADKDCFIEPSPRPEQTKILSFHPSESLGVCWARHQAQTLFEDQDYVLMIDSHMRFIPGWDTALIEEIRRCGSLKPFLATYPPGYTPPDNLAENPLPVVMQANAFTNLGDVRFKSESLARTPEQPLRGAFLAGGFVFAPGAFVREVPYDPHVYFDHEEITLAARAFTHGWDVFSPTGTYVYHYYNIPNNGQKRAMHWTDRKDWGKMQISSRARYNHLLSGVEPADKAPLAEIEKYGLGTVRTLGEYEAFSGLDFKKKVTSERALKAQFVEHLDHYRNSPKKGWKAEPVVVKGETLAPLCPLTTGDILPPFVMKDDSGAGREISIFAGRPLILCILPGAWDAYVQEFASLYVENMEKIQKTGTRLVFVAPIPSKEAADFRKRNNIPQGVLADENLGLCRALGMAGLSAGTPFSICFDAGQRFVVAYNNRNAKNHIADVIRAAEHLQRLAAREPTVKPPLSAPCFIVPDVLTPENCRRVTDYWEKGRKYAGAIERAPVQTVHRTDVDVRDIDFMTRLDVLLAKRLLPELRKVFSLDATRRDKYKVGLYDAADKGFASLHRETGTPSQAHRRVTVSISLGEDYEGGWLLLPEYGPYACFRGDAGSAMVYSSATMTAVTPVTRGRKFTLSTSFFGEAEEAWRKKHHKNPEDTRLLCRKDWPHLLCAENIYTQAS